MDDITALVMGRNKMVAEMAKKVLKRLREEVEKKGLKLSVNEDGNEGKSEMITSCGFLEKNCSSAPRKKERRWQTVLKHLEWT